MTVAFIPPRDPRAIRLEQITEKVRAALKPFVKGKSIGHATDAMLEALSGCFSLPQTPTKGATVMTEAAALKNKPGEHPQRPKTL